MNKKVVIALSLILIIIIFFFPKISFSENDRNFEVCNCIGLESGKKCFGLRLDCSIIEKKSPLDDKNKQKKRLGVDLTLLLDKSYSMNGNRLIEAKNAAIDLIDKMEEQDRMSIIGFDNKVITLIDYTSNKEELIEIIENIVAEHDTFYAPALKKANQIHQNSREDAVKKIIFLSDGEPSSDEDLQTVYNDVYSLTSLDVCLYTIGYGNDISEGNKAEEILKNMAEISQEKGGCGNYYKSLEDWYHLSDIFQDIYTDLIDQDLIIYLNEPQDLIYLDKEVPFNISTNVPSVCSYIFNHGQNEIIFQNTFSLAAVPGRNHLQITCKKSIGYEQKKEIKYEFYYKSGLISYFRQNKIKPKKELDTLNNQQIEFLFDEIIDNQELEIVKRISPRGSGTFIYVLVKNTKPITLKNVNIEQIIPPTISNTIDDFSTNHSFQIKSIQPITISFNFQKIEPDEIVSFGYTLNQRIDHSELNNILTKISYDEITRNDIKKIIGNQNKTRDLFFISTGKTINKDGTKGIINLKPKQKIDDLKIYLKIPKCMAYDLNQIYFKNQNYKVIAQDPLILWQFQESDEEIDIEYQIDKKLAEECEKDISIITIGEPIETDEVDSKRDRVSIVYIFPVIILPLIIIIIINKKILDGQVSEKRKKFVRIFLVVFLITFSVIFFYPKDKFKDDSLCECFGVANQKLCYGYAYSCNIPRALIEMIKERAPECVVDSCEDVRKYISLNPFKEVEKGVDLLIMLDHSRSMEENNKMQQAKAALNNLVNKIESNNRLSIIKFDDSSELIQDFTSEKKSVIDSINGINLGLSTKYVPALITAQQNFLNNGNRDNQWQVFFVSDGAPGDEAKPISIFNKVREMAEDDICINTLGFGSEITPGSEAEYILREMASISFETSGCGVYYYSPKEMSTLSRTLGKMYEESVSTRSGLDMDLTLNSLELTSYENFLLEGKIHSEINGLEIPGNYQLGAKKYCSPPADVKLTLKKNNSVPIEYTMFFDINDKRYKLDRNIPEGSYKASINANIKNSNGDSCDILDTLAIGNLEIADFSGFDKCTTEDCYEINKYLFSNVSKKNIIIFITDYAYVPQNLSITQDTTVLWKNIGKKPHTVTSGIDKYDGYFHSGKLYPGQSFNYTFKEGSPTDYFDNLSTALKGNLLLNTTKNFTIGNFSLKYKKNIDLSLLIDRSGSMTGGKLENVKLASMHLADIIYPGDRISIVKFSDDANIATTFTDDRSILINAIEKVHSGGSTLYIPAFLKAKENYNLYGNNDSGKIIIFLSDGEPWDDGSPYTIYHTVEKMIDDGICVYAIGYGEEVFPGSKSEAILKKIVDLSTDSTKCGNYLYSPSDQIRLSKIFGSIYQDAVGKLDVLTLENKISKSVFFDNESTILTTKVKSSFNNNFLPGKTEPPLDLCGPPALVTVKLSKPSGKIIKIFEMEYRGDATGYYTEIENIRPGEYILDIEAQSICSNGDKCNFEGNEKIDIIVLSSNNYEITPLFLVFLIVLAFTLFLLLWKSRTET